MAFGKLLVEARGERNQQELADSLGVSQATISSWETDQSSPRRHRLGDIARAYSVPLDDLVKAWLGFDSEAA